MTPYKRGMISWTPLGKDICPYGGRDDELVTTEHPRDTEGTRPVKILCMQETLLHSIVWMQLYMWDAIHIRMQMRAPEVDTEVLSSPWLEVETRAAWFDFGKKVSFLSRLER